MAHQSAKDEGNSNTHGGDTQRRQANGSKHAESDSVSDSAHEFSVSVTDSQAPSQRSLGGDNTDDDLADLWDDENWVEPAPGPRVGRRGPFLIKPLHAVGPGVMIPRLNLTTLVPSDGSSTEVTEDGSHQTADEDGKGKSHDFDADSNVDFTPTSNGSAALDIDSMDHRPVTRDELTAAMDLPESHTDRSNVTEPADGGPPASGAFADDEAADDRAFYRTLSKRVSALHHVRHQQEKDGRPPSSTEFVAGVEVDKDSRFVVKQATVVKSTSSELSQGAEKPLTPPDGGLSQKVNANHPETVVLAENTLIRNEANDGSSTPKRLKPMSGSLAAASTTPPPFDDKRMCGRVCSSQPNYCIVQ